MADEDRKRAAQRALVRRILTGDGRASPELRRNAFDDGEVPPSLQELVAKVVASPTRVTDADFDAGKAAGFNEDQLFELVICAAVGEATRQYEAGLAALDEAVG